MKQIAPVLTILGLSAPALTAAAVWNSSIFFNEFAGSAGGFESGPVTYAGTGSAATATRQYDVLRAVSTDPRSGQLICAPGQDGVSDLTITSRVMTSNGGRWGTTAASNTGSGLQSSSLLLNSTSRSGDSALVAFEISFAPGLEVTADQFALKLVSGNGYAELYEWSMVTLGGYADAPFDPAHIADYRATDYSQTGSGTYYNAMGVPTGGPGTSAPLANGRSMSRFLTGAPGSTQGGLVQQGWFAAEDFTGINYDGPEDNATNPESGTGSYNGNLTVSGSTLGLDPHSRLNTFTVWFGYNDVGFDSNGDGFTSTDGNNIGRITRIDLGASLVTPVPEPGTGMLCLVAGMLALRRRRHSTISKSVL